MNISKLVLAIVCLIFGIAVGFLSSEGIRGIISNEKQLKSQINELLVNRTIPLASPIEPIGTATAIDIAHKYSREFRKQAGYCDYTPPTNPPAGFVPININGEGFMNISLDNAIDIVSSIVNIRKMYDVTSRPSKFRLINGIDNNNTTDNTADDKNILMIVALDANNLEIPEIVKEGISYSLIQKLDDPIDCPIHCDFARSEIILKDIADIRSSCVE